MQLKSRKKWKRVLVQMHQVRMIDLLHVNVICSLLGMVIMESLLPRIQATLQLMKDMDVGKDYRDDEKRTEVIELLGKFIEKSLQGGAVLDDLKLHFTDLRNEQMLLKESEYRLATFSSVG